MLNDNMPNVPITILRVFIELHRYLIKLTKPLTTFAWSNFKQSCFTFCNLGKKFPFWENFSNVEKAWWNCYKKWLLANKAEAKRREKRPSKTAPAKIQGQFSLFQYCKRPLRWGQSTLALLWARGLYGHDAWQGFSTAKTAGMFQF